MIATRLSSVWQVAGVAAAALCCYLVSQSVAAERASLAKVDRQIASAQQDIVKLKTEISTRSRMGQLESWNAVFALRAPRPGQVVSDGVQLASLYGRRGQPALPLDPAITAQQGAVDRVAYQSQQAAAPPTPAPAHPPAAPAPEAEPAQPLLRVATYVRPKVDRLAPDPDASVTRASYQPRSSLLPADIGALAAAEAADRKGARAKADR